MNAMSTVRRRYGASCTLVALGAQQKSLSNGKPNSMKNSNGDQTDGRYGKQKSYALTVCYTSLTVCKLFGAEPNSLLTRRHRIHTVVRLKSVWANGIPFAFRKANGLSHSTAIVVCILTVCILFASRPTSCVREHREHRPAGGMCGSNGITEELIKKLRYKSKTRERMLSVTNCQKDQPVCAHAPRDNYAIPKTRTHTRSQVPCLASCCCGLVEMSLGY